jgi:serine phosphatase RsbU (regulator of sigma subunit)
MNDVLARILNKLFDVFPQADEGFIVLCDELLQHLIPKAMKTRSGPAAGSLHISRTIVGKVLDKRLALLLTDACGDGVLACSESIVESHIRSVMCVPLVGCADKPLGILQLHTESSTNAFGQNDLDLLVSIAGAMALAVENAKLHEELVAQERLKRDLQVAREVQQGFLPVGVPVVAGYQFYALYQPALSVGGDYYDFINLPDGRLVICIGDVSGKGVSAALCMAHLASDMRLAVTTANSLAEALQMANCSLNAPWMSMRFVTLLLMELEPCQHKLTVVNAGHMAPLLREPGGTLSEIGGDKAGFPLNVVPTGENKYEAVTIDLPPGSCVFACTDGVTEAEDSNGDMLGMDRLREVVSKAPANPVAIGEAVGHSVREFAADQSQHDDLTLVCFGRMLDHNDVGPPNPLGG